MLNVKRLTARIMQPFFWYGLPRSQELMNFCYQFAAMLSAGVSMLPALEILAQQADNSRLKMAIRSAVNHVGEGKSLAEALAEDNTVFSKFFTSMIEAGEAGGLLEQTMQRLAFHYEKKSDLEQKIKTATTYPKLVFLLMVGVVIFLLAFVIPGFAPTFAGMGVELPRSTSLIIALGEGIKNNWKFIVGGAAVFCLVLKCTLKTRWGNYFFNYLQFRLPLFGPLYHKVLIARFCRTFGAMLGSGVGLLAAMDLAKYVVHNSFFSARIERVKKSILRGKTVARTLAETDLFPQLVIGMLHVGEESGRLDEMLARAANLYEIEANYLVERLATLLEPAMLIFLSFMVGGIVLAIFVPLFNAFSLYL